MEKSPREARQYSKSKTRLMVTELFLTIAFLLAMLLSGASLLLKDTVANWSRNFYLQVGLYLVVFSGIYYLLFLGLDFYGGFLLEHKFKLSNQTVLGWLKKDITKGLLSLAMLLAGAEALYFSLRHFPNNWWLLATAACLIFTIVLGKITPVLIIPLFYKCRPLADSELKEKLLNLGKNCGVRIQQVFEVQLSRDTQKANAAVAGLGKGRRIFLSDTLLKNYSNSEIEAIFAHELGHVQMLHTWKILRLASVFLLAGFYLTFLSFRAAANFFPFEEIYDISAFPFLLLIMMIIGLILTPIQNGYLRRLEKQADMFAIRHIESPDDFASAMTKLAEQNLSDPSPSRWEELLLYDHPPIWRRLRYVREKNNRNEEKVTVL